MVSGAKGVDGFRTGDLDWVTSFHGLKQALNKMTIATVMPQLVPETTEGNIENCLRELKQLPTTVSDWKVEFGIDHADDPAVFVTITVEDDDITDEKVRYDKRIELFKITCSLVKRMVDREKFVYVDFRMPSDPK